MNAKASNVKTQKTYRECSCKLCDRVFEGTKAEIHNAEESADEANMDLLPQARVLMLIDQNPYIKLL